MKKLRNLLILLSVFALTACAPTYKLGTGLFFEKPEVNPEPEKSALVYFFRDDGMGIGDRDKYPIEVHIIKENDPSSPVAVLMNEYYRPFLFEPGNVTLGIPTFIYGVRSSTKEPFSFKAGQKYCIETGWRWRGVSVLIINEMPFDECMSKIKGFELAKSINNARKENNSAPLQLNGFKEMPEKSIPVVVQPPK